MAKRDTYESLMKYLNEGQEKIQYPDRLATQLRNSQQYQRKIKTNTKRKVNLCR